MHCLLFQEVARRALVRRYVGSIRERAFGKCAFLGMSVGGRS